MTTRNALEFVQDVSEAVREATGIDTEEEIAELAADLVRCAVDEKYREAIIREMFSSDFTEDETTRLLSLRPSASEAVIVARAIVTGATRIARRQRVPPFSLTQIVKAGVVMLAIFLRSQGTHAICVIRPSGNGFYEAFN